MSEETIRIKPGAILKYIPNYCGNYLETRDRVESDNSMENLRIFCQENELTVDHINEPTWCRIRTSTTAQSLLLLRLMHVKSTDEDVLIISSPIYKLYETALSSGFTVDDYSIKKEDGVTFVIGKKDLITIFKLSEENA